MTGGNDKGALLAQLRLDAEVRDEGSGHSVRLWVAGAVVVLAAAGVAVFSMQRAQVIHVDVSAAVPPASQSGDSTAILQATGYVTARRQATVSSQVTGTLNQVLIEEGEHVKAGQVLARLENTAQLAQLAQAQAQLNAAKALLQQFIAQWEQSRRDLTRNEALVGIAISQQALETARTQTHTLETQVETQRRQVDVAKANVDGAKVQLDYTVVKAPFNGVITAKAAQTGEIVSPMSAGGGFTRTGVGTIVDMDSLEVEVDVNEAYINRVQSGQRAQAVLDAYPNWTIPAHVIAIIPTADRSKATVKVRVGFDLKDARILPDMGIRVSFLEAPTPATGQAVSVKGALVPATAIVERNGKSIVFTLDGERAHELTVKAGQSFGDLRLVEGIDLGTKVIRAPSADIQNGTRVAESKQGA